MTVAIKAQYLERPKLYVPPIEGFGKNVTGHTGSNVLTVTDPDTAMTAGPGTLGNILYWNHDNVRVEFAAGLNEVNIVRVGTNRRCGLTNNATLDGFANGHTNGVTVIQKYPNSKKPGIAIGTDATGTNGNVLIRGINLRGNGTDAPPDPTLDDLIRIVAGEGGGTSITDGVLIYRCSFYRASDGACDITQDTSQPASYCKNITIQHCFFSDIGAAILIKYGNHQNISIHHNVFLAGGERQPQVRGNIGPVDFVNNIILCNYNAANYPYDFQMHYYQGSLYKTLPVPPNPPDTNNYGPKFWCSTLANSYGNPTGNLVGNVFLGDKSRTTWDIDSGLDPYVARAGIYCAPHGETADNNYWSGTPNIAVGLSPTLINIPEEFRITRHTPAQLKSMVYTYGCARYGTDQAREDALMACYPL